MEAETASAESTGEKDCMRMEISVVAMTSAEDAPQQRLWRADVSTSNGYFTSLAKRAVARPFSNCSPEAPLIAYLIAYLMAVT
ncbi:hypothetical protein MES5069_70083 [Mesorhizobium escarrei]|uniref:Uncharacterized protein n=1 Tax=Mesorhizobium escarrei TaxID=666018 RepID=A0ABM9EGI4_9HYPH|nr:hypothetical protein MES5069_70083 [Mesorhizobium escarrei]